MIPYDQLCEALDRYNARRKGAAEMALLEHDISASSAQGEVDPGQQADAYGTATGEYQTAEYHTGEYHDVGDDQIQDSEPSMDQHDPNEQID